MNRLIQTKIGHDRVVLTKNWSVLELARIGANYRKKFRENACMFLTKFPDYESKVRRFETLRLS